MKLVEDLLCPENHYNTSDRSTTNIRGSKGITSIKSIKSNLKTGNLNFVAMQKKANLGSFLVKFIIFRRSPIIEDGANFTLTLQLYTHHKGICYVSSTFRWVYIRHTLASSSMTIIKEKFQKFQENELSL